MFNLIIAPIKKGILYAQLAKYVKVMRKRIGLTQVAMFGAEITPAKIA